LLAGRSFVLAGGGSFGVEVATYLIDIHGTTGASDADPIVSDVVDDGTPRQADLERVVGATINVHHGFDTVENMEEKLAIICVGNAKVRRKLFDDIAATPLRFGQVIHPSAYVAATAELGQGVIICPLAFVGPLARIEDNVAVNVQAAIGHDSVLQHSCVISPNASVNGFARCGVASFVGAGAILYPGVSLGDYSKLSAGSVLARSAGDGHLMHGNPATGRQMVSRPTSKA
jgi:sugar O-acyltransferase (sialic acid O-acetyltransferase NeuD family)